jgi:ParB-like chromosome segregation protein Spo0J
LLQPMLVAPLPKGSDTQWGVLAGGRRLAALKMLAFFAPLVKVVQESLGER